MKLSSVGKSVARSLAPLFSSNAAQAAITKGIHFLEALQGIGTGSEFTTREIKALFTQITESNPVIIDVGAHHGQFLNHALKYAPNAAIHAFEPIALSFRQLSAMSAGKTNVHLNKLALSAEPGSGVMFSDQPGSQLSSLTARLRFGVNPYSEAVKLQTLDAYCQAQQVKLINLLKLDVEGHELEVLQGATQLLKQKAILRILFEFGGCNLDTRILFRDLYHFLTAEKMKISRLMPAGKFLPITEYHESLERFRPTNYLATL